MAGTVAGTAATMPPVLQPAELPRQRAGARRTCAALLLAVAALLGLGASTQVAGATAYAPTASVAAAQDAPATTAATTTSSGTAEQRSTASDDPAQKRLRWIIIGLVALAAVVLIATAFFWRATSPSRVVTVSEVDDDMAPSETSASVDEAAEPAPASGRPASPRSPEEVAFAAALMAPDAPLPVGSAPSTPEPVVEHPTVVVPDPVDWPDVEPDRLDLREEPAPRRGGGRTRQRPIEPPLDDAPDPPRFEAAAEPPPAGGPEARPGDWSEWRGIRPLGRVDHPGEHG